MPTFIATFLPMNFCTRTPFIPWMQTHLYCNHHCCQHSLPILLHLITTLVSVLTRDVLVETSVPTATVTIIRICPQLLPTGGKTNGSRTGAIQGLDSGLNNRMSKVNYAQPSATQPHIVSSIVAVPSNPLLILLLGMFLPLLGSLTLV
jgi:hypothetical protein